MMTQSSPSASCCFPEPRSTINPYQEYSLVRRCILWMRLRPVCCMLLTFSLALLIMVFSFLPNAAQSSSVSSTAAAATNPTLAISMESRLRAALWGLFSGDALSAPTHWYYGSYAQVKQDYGPAGIVDYTKPKTTLKGSIMNKSSTNGGGRGSFTKKGTSIIGDVINHGKRDYWSPDRQIHYHATLQKGENTLEAQLARVLMKSIVANDGNFNAGHFRQAYIDFMTTPGSHNDCYASTCHRMFFSNLVFRKLPPEDCPDNDQHNVDTIDGLVLPTISALAAKSPEQAAQVSAETAAVTRKSKVLESASSSWGQLVYHSLKADKDEDMQSHLNTCARDIGLRRMPSGRGSDQMTACYLSSSFPSALDMMAKYMPQGDAWTGLVANANVGGENVHRGALLGSFLGARAGLQRLPSKMIDRLHDKAELEKEIDAFVKAVLRDQ